MLRIILPLAATIGLALFTYDPGVFLVLLTIALLALVLHVLATRLAELDLLTPFLVAIGCLAVALWWFAPDDLDLAGEFDRYAPAPVKRLVGSIGRPAMSPGGTTVRPPADRDLASVPGSAPVGSRSAPAVTAGGTSTAGVVATRTSNEVAATDAAAMPSASSTNPRRRGVNPTRGVTASAMSSSAGEMRPHLAVTLTDARPVSRRGEAVLFVASVSSARPDLPLAGDHVDLFDGGSRIARAALVPRAKAYETDFAVKTLGIGRHNLLVRYVGPHAAASSSAPVMHTVLPANR